MKKRTAAPLMIIGPNSKVTSGAFARPLTHPRRLSAAVTSAEGPRWAEQRSYAGYESTIRIALIPAVLINILVARKLPFPIQPKAVTVLIQPG